MGAVNASIFVFFFCVWFYGSLLWIRGSYVVNYRNKNDARIFEEAVKKAG